MPPERIRCCRAVAAAAWIFAAAAPAPALAETAQQILQGYAAQAGSVPSAERGRRLFTTDFGQPLGWSCSSCHGTPPVGQGKDLLEERSIAPLAPAFNPKRFTDRAKVERAFSQNCKDVVGRPCTALEKADVMSWLLSLQP